MDMGRECGMHDTRELPQSFWCEKLEESDQYQDLDVNVRIMFLCTSKEIK
jgi:hypothetical protein